MSEQDIVPFSLIFRDGFPDVPIWQYDAKLRALKIQINELLGWNYGSSQTLGNLVGGLVRGEQQHIPELGQALTPIPGHGVTFHNPEILASYPDNGSANLRRAFSMLVYSALTPQLEVGQEVLMPERTRDIIPL